MAVNIVEMVAEADECGFDQRCKFGHRVEGHAVYCHHDEWEDSPRKCRRSWYTGGKVKDEDCPGFVPNPDFTEPSLPSPIKEPLCSKCGGGKLAKTDRGCMETCQHCMGDGSEPSATPLSEFQQDTLELGLQMSGKHPGQHDYYNRIAETKEESDGVLAMNEASLIDLRSVSWTRAGASVFLIRLTPKGDAVCRANWAAAKTRG